MFAIIHPDLVSGIAIVLGFLGSATGIVVGFIATIWISKKYSPLQSKALGDLVTTQTNHVEELKAERDDYRTRLHDTREKLQADELKIKELELQPDLTTLATLLQDQTKIMQTIELAFKTHSDCDSKAFEKFTAILDLLPAKFDAQAKTFEEHRKKLLEELASLRSKRKTTKRRRR